MTADNKVDVNPPVPLSAAITSCVLMAVLHYVAQQTDLWSIMYDPITLTSSKSQYFIIEVFALHDYMSLIISISPRLYVPVGGFRLRGLARVNLHKE